MRWPTIEPRMTIPPRAVRTFSATLCLCFTALATALGASLIVLAILAIQYRVSLLAATSRLQRAMRSLSQGASVNALSFFRAVPKVPS